MAHGKKVELKLDKTSNKWIEELEFKNFKEVMSALGYEVYEDKIKWKHLPFQSIITKQ